MSDSNGHQPSATVEDVAAHFGVSERTVRRWLTDTDIPHRRIGGSIRFALAELDEWSAARADPEKAEREAAFATVRAEEQKKRRHG